METITKIHISKKDIDSLGHVNYLRYIRYITDARIEWIRKTGLSWEESKENEIGLVLLNLEISYLKETLLEDTLYVKTTTGKLGNKSFVLIQNIFNQNNLHIAKASTTQVFFDTKERKAIDIPRQISSKYIL